MAKENNGKNSKQDIEIARLEERLKSADSARELAVKDLERRLEGMNDFRKQLDRQADNFVTKTELAATEERLNGEIKLLKTKQDWILWILILGTLITIALNYFK